MANAVDTLVDAGIAEDDSVRLAGFAPKTIIEHITIAHPDLRTTNTARQPDAVVPKKGKGAAIGDAGLRCKLPPRSYHMIRVGI